MAAQITFDLLHQRLVRLNEQLYRDLLAANCTIPLTKLLNEMEHERAAQELQRQRDRHSLRHILNSCEPCYDRDILACVPLRSVSVLALLYLLQHLVVRQEIEEFWQSLLVLARRGCTGCRIRREARTESAQAAGAVLVLLALFVCRSAWSRVHTLSTLCLCL